MDLIEAMVKAGVDERSIVEMFAPNGTASTQKWRCEDGWIVAYTTERIYGGPDHGKFATLLYKPVGKGARSGKPKEWEMVWHRVFSTRKAARRRAEQLYYKRSPKAAQRHGVA